MAVRSSSGPTVGIAAAPPCAVGPAPAAAAPRRPRLHRKKLRCQHRPGKGWGAVAAPFNSLLLHTSTHPQPETHPRSRYDPVMPSIR